MTEHPFAQYVRILGKGKRGSRSLSGEEALNAMQMILNREVEDVQLGAFMMLLRVKEEEPEELLGFVRAVKEQVDNSITPQVDLDWSSYAGKAKHQPWYILGALLLAENGKRIVMHGSAGHTAGRMYSEDVFRELGLAVASNWQEASNQLDKHCLSYVPLQVISPELQRIINFRPLLGLRSPVHSLARLINPCNADHVFQSIFHPSYRPTHQEASHALGYHRCAVIKGDAGEGERRPDAITLVQKVIEGKMEDEQWPALFGSRQEKETKLDAKVLADVWSGKKDHVYGEKAITGTIAILLKLFDDSLPQETAMEQAEIMWAERNKSLL